MDELVDEGITSFKLFMAYPGVFYSDDGQILRAMQQAKHNGSMIMMHAENGIAIDVHPIKIAVEIATFYFFVHNRVAIN